MAQRWFIPSFLLSLFSAQHFFFFGVSYGSLFKGTLCKTVRLVPGLYWCFGLVCSAGLHYSTWQPLDVHLTVFRVTRDITSQLCLIIPPHWFGPLTEPVDSALLPPFAKPLWLSYRRITGPSSVGCLKGAVIIWATLCDMPVFPKHSYECIVFTLHLHPSILC